MCPNDMKLLLPYIIGPLTSTGKSIKISLYIIHIHIHYTLHVSDTLQVSRNQFKLYMMTIICVD